MNTKRADRLGAATNAALQDLAVRLMSRLRVEGECWVWTGGRTATGYGQINLNDKTERAHVMAMLLRHGHEALAAETVNHLCANRACCNPDHLQFASQHENLLHGDTIAARCAAKTHCVRGHEFSPENTYVRARERSRGCRECTRIRQRRLHAAKTQNGAKP